MKIELKNTTLEVNSIEELKKYTAVTKLSSGIAKELCVATNDVQLLNGNIFVYEGGNIVNIKEYCERKYKRFVIK